MTTIVDAIDTLPEELWGKGHYLQEGRYCALGWLYHLAGEPDRTLALDEVGDKTEQEVINRYGIHAYEDGEIISINDDAKSCREMKQRVRNYFEGRNQ